MSIESIFFFPAIKHPPGLLMFRIAPTGKNRRAVVYFTSFEFIPPAGSFTDAQSF